MQTLEEALESVGSSNAYQYRLFLAIALQFFGQGMLLLSPTYLYITPDLTCVDKSTGVTQTSCTGTQDQCNLFSVSITPGYPHNDVVTEFNLICSDAIYTSIASSSMFFGSMIGCLVFSFFGDHAGRRVTLLVSWGVTTLGIIGISFSYNITMFIIFTIIAGFGVNGAFNVCFVILNEASGNSFRQKASIALLIVFALTEIFCAVIFYLMYNWRTLYIIFTLVPSVVAFILCFWIYETPKFYLTNNKMDLAFDALDRIAIANGKPLPNRNTKLVVTYPQEERAGLINTENTTVFASNMSKDVQQSGNKSYGYLDLFRYKSLRKSTIGFMGMLFMLQFIYYGGQYGLSNISTGNSIYLIGGCVGIAELVSYIITHITVEKMPRRYGILWTSAAAILFCAMFLFFGLKDTSVKITTDQTTKLYITIALACLIRVSVSFGFAIQPLYANEVYPTVIRTIGTGFVFSFGLIGSFTAPYTFAFASYYNFNPYFVLTSISLLGPFFTLMVKETRGLELEDEIEEVIRQQKVF